MEDIEFANGDDTVVEEDDDHNFFGDDWEWDQWYPIGNDDDVPRPPMNDFYNWRYGLKPMVPSCFDTIFNVSSSVLRLILDSSNAFPANHINMFNTTRGKGVKICLVVLSKKIYELVIWFVSIGSC